MTATTLARYRKAVLAAITTVVTIASTLLAQGLLHGDVKNWVTAGVVVLGGLLVPGSVAAVPNAEAAIDTLPDWAQKIVRRVETLEQNPVAVAAYLEALRGAAATVDPSGHLITADAQPYRVNGKFAKRPVENTTTGGTTVS